MLQLYIICFRHNALREYIFPRNIFIMPFACLGSWRDDWLWEFIIFFHAFGHTLATNHTLATRIRAPRMTRKIASNDHFDLKSLALMTDRNIWIWRRNQPIGYNICRFAKEICRNIVQNLTFVRNCLWQYDIKSRNPITCHHDQFVADGIYVTNFTFIKMRLIRKLKMCFF